MQKAAMFVIGMMWMAFGLAADLGSIGLPPEAAAAMHGIDAGRIRAHVKFLSDDSSTDGRILGVDGLLEQCSHGARVHPAASGAQNLEN